MDKRVIAIGASAGGVEALKQLCSLLPGEFPAAILIVLHTPTTSVSVLPDILNRAGPIKAVHAQDGMAIQPGRIYIAPPNCHMILSDYTLQLLAGPKVNGHRPAIDPLFQSVAMVCGQSAIGTILSGTLYDGADGLLSIARAGGITIVQDPEDALFPGMPVSAIERGKIDYVLPVQDIARKMIELTRRGSERGEFAMANHANQPDMERTEQDQNEFRQGEHKNLRSLLTCPDCGGVLWEVSHSGRLQYICQIGHQYSQESMLQQQTNSVENALWAAVRALEERSLLAERLANRAEQSGQALSIDRFKEMAKDARDGAESIRHFLQNGKLNPT